MLTYFSLGIWTFTLLIGLGFTVYYIESSGVKTAVLLIVFLTNVTTAACVEYYMADKHYQQFKNK